MKHKLFLSAAFALALVLAACGPISYGAPAATQAPAPASSGPMVMVSQKEGLGSFLADSRGMTLYLFLNDSPNTSNCSGGCAQNWPPFTVNGKPAAGEGVNASLLGTIQRSDGSTQATYNGWPLYYFAGDKQAGDTNGQGVKNVWYAISPAGEKVETKSAAATAAPATQPPAESSSQVIIAGFKFSPAGLQVKVGTTITWVNNDSVPHTVTADDGSFNSETLDTGSTFQFTFNQAGTFTYHCGFHPSMTATITVVP